MNYTAMLNRVKKVSKDANKPSIYIFFDMIWCGIRYGAGYVDYDTIHFWDLNSAQRKTMLTRGINDKYVKAFNNKEYWHYLDNKNEFNEKFSKFIYRSWIYPVKDNKDKILEWLKDKKVFIAKPNNGQCGKGILKINVDDESMADTYKSPDKLYQYLLDNKVDLLEEVVTQADEINAIYPNSVNTIRVVTVLRDTNAEVLAAAMRIGNGGRHVDNFNSGGLVIPINVETGTTKNIAVNKEGQGFTHHPYTGTKIAEIKIPKWDMVINTAKEAAKLIPEVGYVGWDVAITPDGTTLIEGNQFPGHDIYQMPQHIPDKIGILPRCISIFGF
jgi:glutathione synthase/RimK-type ligase-like ATP-grasp enzyme